MKHAYIDVIGLVERLHRHFLDVMKWELDQLGVHDISNVQALLLFNVGDDRVTVGELTQRGYYLGTNVTYNLKKLVENGYVVQERSTHDRRSFHICLSDKGKDLCAKVAEAFDRHSQALEANFLDKEETEKVIGSLQQIERFWTAILDGSLRRTLAVSRAA